MNDKYQDIVIRHIKTKHKIRKIVSYRSDDCDLKAYHQRLNQFIEDGFVPSIFSKAYVKHRSIYDNALAHMYNDYFVMLDIKSFFQSISHKQLSEKLYYELNLIKPDRITRKQCNKIIEDCSINSRGIPLGFVTSPVLSNIYLKDFDGIFYGKLKTMSLENVIYTRYADDLTVSFKSSDDIDFNEIKEKIVCTATEILKRLGLRLNHKKTRSVSLKSANHVRITGISIYSDADSYRHLTVGRKVKNRLYYDALKAYETKETENIAQIKGLQSFILSIEKNGYENVYSNVMRQKIEILGFSSLKELIDSL
ncbi:reverse transcriptase domain-containing protein [uncultured Ruminococcus sp.]|uniref:reverse transcriptase family protein n=1 Tax=uncultured Ruminococcus sp. TaxID=165186 RepID=UPI0029316F7E|nr:reverse transcriptase domain-containing protein [uncultured Ruminococcus sp.]